MKKSVLINKNIPDGKGRECILLLSGGLDSSTLLACLTRRNWIVNALTFNYGQKHSIEIKLSKKLSKHFSCKRHIIFDLPLNRIVKSALTSPSIKVPAGGTSKGIPVTYVPARNLIFLSIAVAWAETTGIKDIFIAVSSVDFSGYPDCREAFINSFEEVAQVATKMGVEDQKIKIHAPLMHLSKRETILMGLEAGLDYFLTSSCYNPDKTGKPCGKCDACLLRKKGFEESGFKDPRIEKW